MNMYQFKYDTDILEVEIEGAPLTKCRKIVGSVFLYTFALFIQIPAQGTSPPLINLLKFNDYLPFRALMPSKFCDLRNTSELKVCPIFIVKISYQVFTPFHRFILTSFFQKLLNFKKLTNSVLTITEPQPVLRNYH
jgi:hypothetical protein